MNITHRTAVELRAEHKPRFLPVLIAALVVGVIIEELTRTPASGVDFFAALLGIAVGVILFFLALRGSAVHLDAGAGTATLRSTGLPPGKTTAIRLRDVRDVTVKTGRDRSRSRVVFVTSEGPVGTAWHHGRTERDRAAVAAARAWMAEAGFTLTPREGKLRVGSRVRVEAPWGETRPWLERGDDLQGRVDRFLPPIYTGSLPRAVVRLDRPESVGPVDARFLLLTQRYDPPQWFDRGEVHVTACRNEPTRWNVGLDRSARALEGTGEYVVLGGDTEAAGPPSSNRQAT